MRRMRMTWNNRRGHSKKAGPGAGVTVALSGDMRRYRVTEPDYDGEIVFDSDGKPVKGEIIVHNLTLVSAYDSAVVRRNAGTLEIDPLPKKFVEKLMDDVLDYVCEDMDEEDCEFDERKVKFTVSIAEIEENPVIGSGYVRYKAPDHFEVERISLGIDVAYDGGDLFSEMLDRHTGTFISSKRFKMAWEALDNPDYEDDDKVF